MVVERKGQDAARLSTVCDLHGYFIYSNLIFTPMFEYVQFCWVASRIIEEMNPLSWVQRSFFLLCFALDVKCS